MVYNKEKECYPSQYIENRPVEIVYFEELKSELPMALSKISAFIEKYNNGSVNPALQERIDCVVADSQGEFKRGKKTLEFDPYSDGLNVQRFVY